MHKTAASREVDKMSNFADVLSYAEKHSLTEKAAVYEPAFRNFIRSLKIKTAVEIGTYRGVTAAFMAEQAEKIYTFDIKDYPEKRTLWQKTGTDNKIVFAKINTISDIKDFLSGITFDFCFIDGPGTAKELSAAFKIARAGGRVLFHNSGPKEKYKVVREYVTTLDVTPVGTQSLYWTGEPK